MTFFHLGPTELRILLSIGIIAAVLHPTAVVFGRDWLLFDVAGVIGAAGLVVTFLRSAANGVRTLYAAEPLRQP
jgi:hypothetical protein